MALTTFQKKYYRKNPARFLEEILEIPINTIKWSENPEYRELHLDEDGNYTEAWDGTPDPIYRMMKNVAEMKDTAVESCTASGKAQPLDTEVLTPTGWVRMGHIRVGDYVVGKDGFPTEVLNVYPQGKRDIYKVTLADGGSVLCDGEHLWTVITKSSRVKGKWKTIPTLQLKHEMSKGKEYFIPVVDPIQHEERELPIDPYVLGALLGDGGMTTSSLTISTSDTEILTFLKEGLGEGYEIKHRSAYDYGISYSEDRGNPLTNSLRELNLLGCNSHTKFIPEEYLFGSVDQRVDLLRGLMDTDGTMNYRVGTSFTYTTVSEKLADGVVALARSLGCSPKKRIKRNTNSYDITLTAPNWLNPFRLSRKSECVKPRGKFGSPKRKIVSIDYHGNEECQCIRVDADDSLYVTEDYIVTHNTFSCAALVLWFLACFGGDYDENGKPIGCSVITLAPTENSLKSNMWKEIGTLWPKFEKHFPQAELLSLEIRMDPKFVAWRAKGLPVGVAAGEQSATRAQGFHDPYMLYILEECPGIPLAVVEAVFNTVTGENNPILAIGNPDNINDGLHQFAILPTTDLIRVSAYDHPNIVTQSELIPGAVSQKSIDKRLARYGTDHPLFMSRIQGICPDVSDLGLFTQPALVAAREHLAEPIKEMGVPGRHSEGWIRVYSEVKHTHLNRYIIFGDVAGDSGKGDWHAAIVFDRLKKEPAAIIRMRGPREDYVTALLQVADMYKVVWTQMVRNMYGIHYWKPLLAWERIGVGALIMDPRIKEYPNLFHKRSVDVLNPNLQATVGWDTTGKSRKIMVDELEQWGLDLLQNPWRLKDERLWTECSTFVWIQRGQGGRFEAQKGSDLNGDPHQDDLVMALGGALVIDGLIPEPEVQEKPPEQIPEIKDDYFKRAIMRRANNPNGDSWNGTNTNDPWAKAKIPSYG